MFNLFKKKIVEEPVKKLADIAQKKVLLIDDNSLNMKVVTTILEEYNMIVKTITSGVEAIELLKRENDFTLILIDNLMPKLSGIDTIKILKQDPSFKTPVVMLTAFDNEGDKEKIMEAGFEYFLSKPINKDELDTVLKKIIKFKKILIVDDDKLSLKISDKFIKRYNVENVLVKSGLECLEKLDEEYDLIFLDDMMPNFTGTQTLKALRTNNIYTPVVVLTGNKEQDAIENYLKIGFNDYLAKPIDNEELERILKEQL